MIVKYHHIKPNRTADYTWFPPELFEFRSPFIRSHAAGVEQLPAQFRYMQCLETLFRPLVVAS